MRVALLVALSASALAGCAPGSPGACLPNDPTLEPAAVHVGESFRVSIEGFRPGGDGGCTASLAPGTTYTVRLSEQYGGFEVVLDELEAPADGALDQEYVVPPGAPAGPYGLVVMVSGTRFSCERPDTECAVPGAGLRVED